MATNKIPSIDDSLQQQRQLLQEETYQRKVATRYFGTVYCSRSSATTLSTCCSFDHAFAVVSNGNSGKKQKLGRGNARTHHVKPLQILWSKFEERWGAHNTVHLDDLARNFALNLGSGLKIKAYHRNQPDATHDGDLQLLGPYLERLAQSGRSFERVDFGKWRDVATGELEWEETCENETSG